MSGRPKAPAIHALDALNAYIKAISDAEGLEAPTIDVRAGSKAGDNYVGVVHKVTVRGRRPDGKEASLALVYKRQPDSVKRREQFHTGNFFSNEAAVYNEVLPAFERFQSEKRLPTGAPFTAYPKCYHADPEALLLEDMTPLGFTMLDRLQTLDLVHCLLIMKEMGRFHALSFAMRDQRPEEFDRIRHAVKETLTVFIPGEQKLKSFWLSSAASAEKKFLETSRFGGDEKFSRPLRRFVNEYYPAMEECVRGEAAEPYAVITHGDCWTNNMLFKYGKDPSIPESLCFLDFQLSRYSSPVLDLVYVLFSCTEQSLRVTHFDALIKVYHDSLARFLDDLGSDADRLFPLSALQNQLARFGKYGLGMAMRFMQLLTCNPDDVPDLDAACDDDTVNIGDALHTGSAECWRRLNGIVEDMVDRGYIG